MYNSDSLRSITVSSVHNQYSHSAEKHEDLWRILFPTGLEHATPGSYFDAVSSNHSDLNKSIQNTVLVAKIFVFIRVGFNDFGAVHNTFYMYHHSVLMLNQLFTRKNS